LKGRPKKLTEGAGTVLHAKEREGREEGRWVREFKSFFVSPPQQNGVRNETGRVKQIPHKSWKRERDVCGKMEDRVTWLFNNHKYWIQCLILDPLFSQ